MPPAAEAFDAVAEQFDERFGAWASVAAQRRAVRAQLLRAFPLGARVLEIGGGTGEDALWLMRRGRDVQVTDPSPAMVRIAAAKLRTYGSPPPVVAAAEELQTIGDGTARSAPPYDGAFSNFAALNCVADLGAVGRALADLVRPGGQVLLVLFGTCAPGEWAVQLLRGDRRAAVRRRARGDVPARLGGREFVVRYHRRRDLALAMSPWFQLVERRAIGIFVPPSAAEPWISRHPRLLALAEAADRLLARRLAPLGDHVAYMFERIER